MAAFRLRRAELELVRKLTEAEVCDLSDLAPGDPGRVVRAEALRRLLLGLPVKVGHDPPRVIDIPGPGVRLCGARIDDRFNLEDARAPGGDPLPPLVLEACVISQPIQLARAHLRYLSLKNSKIVHLCGHDLQVDGPLDISGLSSAEPAGKTTGRKGQGRCWVELQGAQIGGDVEAGRSRFVAPGERADFVAGYTRPFLALHMNHAQIGETLVLDPDVTAIGGVGLAGAQIGADIQARGAHVVAGEADALILQGATIGGGCLLRAMWSAPGCCKPFRAEGQVSLLRTRIAGALDMNGADIQGDLDACGVEVSGFAELGASGDKSGATRFSVTGETSLRGARVDGHLDMSGAQLDGPLIAESLEVGGAVLLSAWRDGAITYPFVVKGAVQMRGAEARRSLEIEGAEFAADVRLDNVEVGDTLVVNLRAIDLSPDARSPVFSLKDAKVGALADAGGAGFGEMRLCLDGFGYDRLFDRPPPQTNETRRSGGRDAGALVARRAAWLRRQYAVPNRPTAQEYSPDPYQRLARFFRSEGFYDEARRITSLRLAIESRTVRSRFWWPARYLYENLFDFGLSANRAMLTFAVFVILGACGAYAANRPSMSPVLVIDTSTVNSVASADAKHRFVPGIALADAKLKIDSEIACGDEIEPVLYALDVFVPALDLNQENRCDVTARKDAMPWRIAKAIYAVLGSIVTSLVILTVSGVLRRAAES